MYRAKLAEEFLEFVLQGTFEARQQLDDDDNRDNCLLYTSPSPRDRQKSRMPSSA